MCHSLKPPLQPKSLSGISCVIATSWSDAFSLFYLSPPSIALWSSSSLSSLRKTPSLPGPKCKCFIFHNPTIPLCSTAHLAVISQQLFLNLNAPKQTPPDTWKIFFFLHLPLCLMGKNKRSRNQGVWCLQAIIPHVCKLTCTHTHTQSAPCSTGACIENKKSTHSDRLFTSHAHTIKSVTWSPIKDENKPASGRCPPRTSTVAIVEPLNHGNWLAEPFHAHTVGWRWKHQSNGF